MNSSKHNDLKADDSRCFELLPAYIHVYIHIYVCIYLITVEMLHNFLKAVSRDGLAEFNRFITTFENAFSSSSARLA
jgi:hypothetical protein